MYGQNYDRYMDQSTISRFQQQYWSTKQAVLKKLGKKDDECIVASDSELDSKLEMFNAVQESCTNLMRVLEHFQDRLIVLAQEENSYGRFLKECGKQDKTRAGKMMIATGKTLSFTAQKRLELRVPLVRLYQEVETFHVRAITDTAVTVEKMEKSRTTYRGNLMWMKDISQQLDPDMNRQLEKFRKVQGHVRKTKVKFDKLKIDTLQKVDLLVASRCNMFSHALVAYQNTLLQFWEKSSKTMTTVADSFKGYQHYEFNMLKELTETSKKLAEETNCPSLDLDDEDDDKDNSPAKGASCNSSTKKKAGESKLAARDKKAEDDDVLLDISEGHLKSQEGVLQSEMSLNGEMRGNKASRDLLTGFSEMDDCDKDDMMLLSEILNNSADGYSGYPGLLSQSDGSFAQQWTATFGQSGDQTDLSSFGFTSMFPTDPVTPPGATLASMEENGISDPTPSLLSPTSGAAAPSMVPSQNSHSGFLPSQLLQMNANFASCSLVDNSSRGTSGAMATSSTESVTSPTNPKQLLGAPMSKKAATPTSPKQLLNATKRNQKERSAWFNLFADLDPLGNPDALGSKSNVTEEDRSC